MKRVVLLALLAACAHGSAESGPPLAQPPPAGGANASAATAAGAAAPGAAGQSAAPPASAASPAAPAEQPQPSLMADEPFRAERPRQLDRKGAFDAPVPVERKLKNGARVLVVTNHKTPLVAIDVRFLHGTDANPKDKPGLAEFQADAAQEATKKRSARQLARDLEDLAANLNTFAGQETSGAHLNCLTETLPRALDILADVVLHPAFKAEDVERVRTLRLANLEQKKASIGLLARDEANRLRFGPDHPWGKPAGGTEQSVKAIAPKDLQAWHDAWWVPANVVISVAGDVEPDEAVKQLEKAFAGWAAKPLPKLDLPPLLPLQGRTIVGLDRPGATQSQVWVIGPLFPAKDADAIPLRVANFALGGLFTSRLNLNLREQHGYSYGVFSALTLGRTFGTFEARGGIVAKSTAPAVDEYEKELAKFASGDLTDFEFSRSRDMFVRGLPALLETNDAVSGAMANLVSLGLPMDYYRRVPEVAAALTREQVAGAAKKWLHPDRWPVIIVGAVSANKEALEKLNQGALEVRSVK